MIRSVAAEIPASALRLMDAFWPGPLTLVLKRSPSVPDIVSAGLDTVAVRVPKHPIALNLIDCIGQPIAAPSANRSGRPSSTLANHVMEELGDSVDLILDGGPTQVGVESTVLDLTGTQPVLARPGGVSKEDIEQVCGAVLELEKEAEAARSPGTRPRHYSPRCRVVLVAPTDWHSSIPLDQTRLTFFRRVDGDAGAYARVLFASLLEAEDAGVEVLYVEEIDKSGLGAL